MTTTPANPTVTRIIAWPHLTPLIDSARVSDRSSTPAVGTFLPNPEDGTARLTIVFRFSLGLLLEVTSATEFDRDDYYPLKPGETSGTLVREPGGPGADLAAAFARAGLFRGLVEAFVAHNTTLKLVTSLLAMQNRAERQRLIDVIMGVARNWPSNLDLKLYPDPGHQPWIPADQPGIPAE